jgi:hypothetical protein
MAVWSEFEILENMRRATPVIFLLTAQHVEKAFTWDVVPAGTRDRLQTWLETADERSCDDAVTQVARLLVL